jgi:hypothetical protein
MDHKFRVGMSISRASRTVGGESRQWPPLYRDGGARTAAAVLVPFRNKSAFHMAPQDLVRYVIGIFRGRRALPTAEQGISRILRFRAPVCFSDSSVRAADGPYRNRGMPPLRLAEPVLPSFLPGEIPHRELFKLDPADEVVQAPPGGDVADDEDPLAVPVQRQAVEEPADAGDGLPPAFPARVGLVRDGPPRAACSSAARSPVRWP